MINVKESTFLKSFLSVFVITLMISVSTTAPLVSGTSDSWNITKLKTQLPSAIFRASLVWTGTKAYIFSGRTDGGEVDTILQFDPSTGKVTTKGAHLNMGRTKAAAAWVSPYAYIFGGTNMTTTLNDVLRYDPATDTLEVMPFKMPFSRVGLTAVSVGDSIILMGGRNDTAYMSPLLRFYPSNESFVNLPAPQIQGGGRTSVISGDQVYTFGICPNAPDITVLDVDPYSGNSHKVEVGPYPRFYWASSAWTGSSALIFGGDNYSAALDQFLEFTPSANGTSVIKSVGKLPAPNEDGVAFYDQNNQKAYLLGGRGVKLATKDILEFSRTTKTATVEVSPERALLVLGLMGFTIAVVLLQFRFQSPDRDAGTADRPIPKPLKPAAPLRTDKNQKK